MKKLRVAFIGFAHVHVHNMSKDLAAFPDRVELVGIADYAPFTEFEHNARLTSIKKLEWFEGKIYDDYKELLKKDIDLAVVNTDISSHADICEEILAMDINVLIEKPMALSMADAKRMYRAHLNSKASLMINWPVAWFPAFRKAKELADSGIIGKIQRVQYRCPATNGPFPKGKYTEEEMTKLWWYNSDRGGGSISDYAGYGCLLTTWITGRIAKRVSGFKKNFNLPFAKVEDYSTFTIDFGDSIGYVEGSWSTFSNAQIPTGPIIYGSDGVIVSDRYDTKVKVYNTAVRYVATPDADMVVDTAEDKVDTMAQNMIAHLLDGAPLYEMVSAEFNMRVMAAFDAGIRSCESGNVEDAYDPFE